MNIVSMAVTGALMGIIGPGVAQMAIQPVIAQKRAANFGVAESRAVGYSALNEGAPALTPWQDKFSSAHRLETHHNDEYVL